MELPPASAGASATAAKAPASDAGACTVRWEACHRVAGPTAISGEHVGQVVEVVWNGSAILVAYDDFPAAQMSTPPRSLVGRVEGPS